MPRCATGAFAARFCRHSGVGGQTRQSHARQRAGADVAGDPGRSFRSGSLEPLLQDPTMNDILVNTYRHVYVERAGLLEETRVMFKDDAHLMHIIDKIVTAVGRRMDEIFTHGGRALADGSQSQRYYSASGHRWPHAFHPALRSYAADRRRPYRQNRTLTQPMLELLQGAVEGPAQHCYFRRDGSAGKTTFSMCSRLHLGQGKDRHD